MAFYEKKWWKKLFPPAKPRKVDVLKDIDAIREFLKEVHHESSTLISNFDQLEELEKERQIASAGIIQVNLETQAGLLDKINERYQFFQDDVDINGSRVKIISKEFLKHAHKAGLKDLVAEKKKDPKWKLW
jgi:hypothetical protein